MTTAWCHICGDIACLLPRYEYDRWSAAIWSVDVSEEHYWRAHRLTTEDLYPPNNWGPCVG